MGCAAINLHPERSMEDKSVEFGALVTKVQDLAARKNELETALLALVKALERNPEAFPYPELVIAKEVLNRA